MPSEKPCPPARGGSAAKRRHARGGDSRRLVDDARRYESALGAFLKESWPTFVSFAVAPGHEGPIPRSGFERAPYLQTSLHAWSRRFKRALLS